MEPWIFRSRPAVHVLCKGSFLQQQVRLGPEAFATPLSSVGFAGETTFAIRFSRDILGRELDHDDAASIVSAHDIEQPAAVLTVLRSVDADARDLVASAWPTVTRMQGVLAWISGERPEPFAVVIDRPDGPEFSLRPPVTRRRQHLEFGDPRAALNRKAQTLFEASARDSHFAFALALYQDALRDSDPEMRVSRFFMCLESLASYLKSDTSGSRKAVRRLLGLEDGAFIHYTLPSGRVVKVDRVEIAGRIRDKLFHGRPFDSSDLTGEAREFYEWASGNSDALRDILAHDCELELLKWANGTSLGLPDSPEAL